MSQQFLQRSQAAPALGLCVALVAAVVLTSVLCNALSNPGLQAKASEVDSGKQTEPNQAPDIRSGRQDARATSKLGKALFEQLTCATCHSISGNGGCLGPPLDGVAAFRSEEYMYTRLCNSAAESRRFRELSGGQPELMPHPRIAADKARLVVDYLLTLPAPAGGFQVPGHGTSDKLQFKTDSQAAPATSDSASSRAGQKLYYDLGCAACHSIGQVGGHLAPRLDGVAGRRSREYIVMHITNPVIHEQQTANPVEGILSVMPPAHATAQDIEKIADFLMTLPPAH